MKLPFIKTSISILNLWLWDFGFAKMENTGCLPSVMNTKVEHTGAARKDPPGLRRHTCSKFWRNPSGDSMSMPIRISIAIARLPSFQGWIWKLFSLHLYCLEKRKSYIYICISLISALYWYDMLIWIYQYTNTCLSVLFPKCGVCFNTGEPIVGLFLSYPLQSL